MTEPIAFPAAPEAWLAFATTRADERLAQVDEAVTALKDGTSRSALEILQLWNDLQIALRSAHSEAEVLAEVHPERAVREGAESRTAATQAKDAELMTDAELAAVFAAADATGLDADAARLIKRIRRDFRRGGADRDAETRERVRELAARETELGVAFARSIREGRREIRVAPDDLAGLPADFLADRPVGDDGLVAVSTDNLDVMAVMTYAHDRGTRTALRIARSELAWPENDPVLAELLHVRQQHAELLGYASWADYETEDRMAGSSARVASFLAEVDEATRAAADAEYDLLLARLREDVPDATEVTNADLHYLLARLHEERFAVDAQEVRRHLHVERVLGGLLSTTGRLFDIEYVPVVVPTWHEDVRSYDVVRAGTRIGRIHLDLHPREGKFNHAACFPLAPGVRGRVLPEAALVCNFPRGLMEHREVQTFFHEFGHLVHDILGGDQEWAPLSGVATEWDFVEAPSQMLEEWVWDAEVLAPFATDESGVPIPADLVERMREAEAFGRALLTRTQLGHARVSYHLHMDRPADLAAATDHWYRTSTPVRTLPGTHSYASFGHLTGYGSCYYTYQWSLVIARDLLTGFAGLLDEESASRYRREILEPGGRRDAADLVEAFLGRPFTVDAYREWMGSPGA
ncbi:Zn-dependent oligopeptidase [Microbacterium esteraromaticum]|uniref:Zn-dependent oligopeptidase n=1 Tax=Microbacterium esteraromaticum TaxID=57043 RepID=A0A7D7WDI2_9MICO|nr:M3 family metallopeptidase [Microbacterium esteraromaticum]QMU96211.1 Zn-dependent oligopeptidase [Microbacterium esteraromaticum]